jgi:hypothetical protein
MRRDDGRRRAQKRGEYFGAVEPTLMRGAQDAGEHLLRVGPASGSIAAAAQLACDDGRPNRLFGAPVRGVEVWIDQEAEERRQFRIV